MAGSDKTVSAFHDAVTHLTNYESKSKLPLGPNFGVAIAVLLHRSDPTRYVIPTTGAVTSTSDLQLEVCDPTWAKAPSYLPSGAEGPIYKPFTASFKGRSPQTNNWRNSFDIQGGIGCSAPYTPAYMQSTRYIAEHRFDCSFREKSTGYCSAAGTGALCFNPTKKGSGIAAWSDTSAHHRPKLLRRGVDHAGVVGYWSVEPTVDSLADLLGDPGARVPATSFATALFAGSPYWSQWSDDHSASRLQKLLALDDEQFFTLFSGPASTSLAGTSPLERATQSEVSTWSDATPTVTPEMQVDSQKPTPSKVTAATPVDYVPQDTEIVIALASKETDPERRRRLLENATQGHRRVLNVLAQALKERGYAVREQAGGYDLHAFKAPGRHVLFEAKTWTPTNLASQVRSGWAQLEEYAYRYRAMVGDSPDLVLVLNHEPPSNFWAWGWFRARQAPYVLWIDENDIKTFAHDAEWLNTLLN